MSPVCYFINLDRVPERADFMRAQFAGAGIFDPVRISAVDARQADMEAVPRYTPKNWGPYWTLKSTEIAVFESHRTVWERIAETNQPGGVFEDDVLMSQSAGAVIADLGQNSDRFDMVKLDALSGVIRLGPEITLGNTRLRPVTEVLPSAAAYLLSPEGARNLLRRSQSYCDHLDDYITRPQSDYRAFQLTPAVAVQGMFADVADRPDIPASIAGSERTGLGQAPVDYDRGPAAYRLLKELRRAGRRLARKTYSDRQLLSRGGLVAEVPLAEDMPTYR